MREYDAIADWYATDRDLRTGVPEAIALAGLVPPGARILDIGCGTGNPITRTLLGGGSKVFGMDSSARMLARFRVNFPETPVIQGLVQACGLAANAFDAAIAWGVMFHLTHADQARAMANLSQVLKAGAPFLFTSGDEHGNIDGVMNGVSFHYFSFSIEGYRSLLRENGFTLLDTHADQGENRYYLARKSA
jgi:SAM-dependent methyltransferase